MEKKRLYLTNDTSVLLREEPRLHLIESLGILVRGCPPTSSWKARSRTGQLKGLFTGPTSIAYLFLWLSRSHPSLEIEGKSPEAWCAAYLDCGQSSCDIGKNCGIIDEYICFSAVKAAFTQDTTFVNRLIHASSNSGIDAELNEWIYGRAGTLYLLRMARTWVPSSAAALNAAMKPLIEHILAYKSPWTFHGTHYLGAAHGDIGILAQIMLCDPSRAPVIEPEISRLLDLQAEEGNWPVKGTSSRDHLVQFCHGAPGFILALEAIRQYLPSLRPRIDAAIAKGRDLTWKKGLLIKEPNLCHGIHGNALTLEGPQRDHFMALATQERIQKGLADGTFRKGDDPFGAMWGEAGRAWAWMVMDGGVRGYLAFTDI